MKRPSADRKIGLEVKWTGKHYLPLTDEEREKREHLRWQIQEEGILDAHAEFVRRGGFRRIES